MLLWQLHATTHEILHTNILNVTEAVMGDILNKLPKDLRKMLYYI